MQSKLDYFALDTDIVSDPRIRKLTADQGAVALSIYIVILSRVYSSPSGYYYKITDADYNQIATCINCRQACVTESIRYCFHIGLFTRLPSAPDVITSPSIQRRYLKLCKLTGTPATLSDHCLIDNSIQADRFPPTLQDVATEIALHNWSGILSAEEFIEYYTKINWKIKGEPITDWREKVSKWADRRLNPNRKKRSAKPPEQPDRPAYPAPTERPKSTSGPAISWDDFQKKLKK